VDVEVTSHRTMIPHGYEQAVKRLQIVHERCLRTN
jgi:hypothetical protein